MAGLDRVPRRRGMPSTGKPCKGSLPWASPGPGGGCLFGREGRDGLALTKAARASDRANWETDGSSNHQPWPVNSFSALPTSPISLALSLTHRKVKSSKRTWSRSPFLASSIIFLASEDTMASRRPGESSSRKALSIATTRLSISAAVNAGCLLIMRRIGTASPHRRKHSNRSFDRNVEAYHSQR